MDHLSLTPAAQAVLKALAELGQGNVHELAERSGKARSTTDRAINTLAGAGLIVQVDTGADPAEGTPARWTLAEAAAAELAAAGLSDEPGAGPDQPAVGDPDADRPVEPDTGAEETDRPGDDDPAADPGDRDNEVTDRQDPPDAGPPGGGAGTTNPAEPEARTVAVPAARPGDRKVMAIKGVLADYTDGASVEVIVAESGISHPTTLRLLAAMEQADAARRLPGLPERWIAGPTKASEVDPNPEPPRCPLCFQVVRGVTTAPSAVAAVLPLLRPDGTLRILGPGDEIHVVSLPTRLPERSASTPGVAGRRTEATVNADGSEPFGRGELEKLSIAVLAAHPGRPMTPQEIATTIGTQLGRTVSPGAVRNNCTKAAAAGTLLLFSETPLQFVSPPPADQHHPDAEPARAAVDGAAPAGVAPDDDTDAA